MASLNEDSGDATNEQEPQASSLVTSFGIITDIQYADVDDGSSYGGRKKRYYRNSLNLVSEAVKHWCNESNENKLKFVIQMGDLIDGKAAKAGHRDEALNTVLNEFSKLPVPLYHCWGNHEFYNYLRKDLVNTQLNSAKLYNTSVSNNANYYSIDIIENRLKLIVLDFYEFSALGFEHNEQIYKDALELLQKHNKNTDLNSANDLRGHAKRFTLFNGSTSASQLQWLNEQLKYCKERSIKVIVSGHVPIHAQACQTTMCLAWNCKEVLDLLWLYEKTVVAYLSGHDHDGGYFRDKANIHHLTLPAILETESNSNAFATVKVFENKISIQGVGNIDYYDVDY